MIQVPKMHLRVAWPGLDLISGQPAWWRRACRPQERFRGSQVAFTYTTPVVEDVTCRLCRATVEFRRIYTQAHAGTR